MVNNEFIETICCRYGQATNVRYHIERAKNTLSIHDASEKNIANIIESIKDITENVINNDTSISKLTIKYDTNRLIDSKLITYTRQSFEKYKIFHYDSLDYSFKYSDRSKLDQIALQCVQGEIAFIFKNGLLTDTTFTNIVCEKHDGEMYTPLNPLLSGTTRRRLLDENLIKAANITMADLQHFKRFHLINALNELGDIIIENHI